ncbi:MAG: 5'-methylthioadenosine/adenosylhomocysteine nucleosidase [Clostridia bacterium]|nr:5'-methylthioadenosine/adenosylhomocysteine nucleosidase [Clostridia bacterium]
MIGIICALDKEAEKLRENMTSPSTEHVGQLEFTSGELKGQSVVIGMAGVGKVNAAMCVQAMILRYAPTLIVNSGVAGSLSAKLDIGDIAVGTGVVEHDFDTTAMGDPPAFFNELNGDTFPCDPDAVQAILRAAAAEGVRAMPAKIASGDRFISEAMEKERLVSMFGAEACEMESGAIAHVCFKNDVKCAIIRAISDSTDGEHHVEFYKFLPVAADNSARVLMRFLQNLQ